MPRKPKLPDPLAKRDLLYAEDKAKGVDHVAIADAYVDGDRLVEAVQFYERAGAHDRLQKLKSRAIESGDSALLLVIAAALKGHGGEVGESDWSALAKTALAGGKFAAAAEAFVHAGRPDDAEKAREKLDDLLGRARPAPGEEGQDDEDGPGPASDDDPRGPRPGQQGHQAKIGG